MKAIIFDFDGVIHNTFDIHYKANKAYFKREISEEDFKNLSDGNNYKQHSNYKFNLEDYTKLIKEEMLGFEISPEIKEELAKIAKEHQLFIISSSSEILIEEILKKNGVNKLFTKILGRETSVSKVERFNQILDSFKFNKDEVIFVTDTLGDILEANELNINTIAVDFGYHEKERLEKGNPYKLISDFKEILPILQNS